MGRGLSPLQRDILGLAYTVNAYTQGGTPAVKTGDLDDRWKLPTIQYEGPPDIKPSLAIYAVKRIPPSTTAVAGFFHGTKEYKSAKAAVTRAITRLIGRGLMVHIPDTGQLYRWGYVLTADGFDIAKCIEFSPPALADAVELFGIQAGNAFHADQAEYLRVFPTASRLDYANWMYDSLFVLKHARQGLIERMVEALSVTTSMPATGSNHYVEKESPRAGGL